MIFNIIFCTLRGFLRTPICVVLIQTNEFHKNHFIAQNSRPMFFSTYQICFAPCPYCVVSSSLHFFAFGIFCLLTFFDDSVVDMNDMVYGLICCIAVVTTVFIIIIIFNNSAFWLNNFYGFIID